MKAAKPKVAVPAQVPEIQASEDGLVHIDKEFVAALPLLQYEGKIELITDEKAARKAVKALCKEEGPLQGRSPRIRHGNAPQLQPR